jgi:spore coat polysaccharide biosynthesis protein SpsF
MKENKIPGFITVRTTSSRLPNKCLLPFGGINVIQHIIERALKYNIEPILCTSTHESDDILEEIAKEYKIKYFRGSLANKLKRWLDCANHFNIKCFHTVDADDPFFDGNEMKRSYRLLTEGNYDIVCPTESSSNGGASTGYSLTKDIIEKAIQNLNESTDTEMMWYYIDKVPNVKKKVLDEENKNQLPKRLTLDYEEDYWLLVSIQKILGNLTERSNVENLFFNNPDLYKINWFRNVEMIAGQESKKI